MFTELLIALNHTRRQLAHLQRAGVPEPLLVDLRAREATLRRAAFDAAALRLCAAHSPGSC